VTRCLAPLLVWVALLWTCHAEAQTLPGLDIAALAVAEERLYVGGFDQGLFVLEPDRAPRQLTAPALSVHINALAWSARERALWVGTARGLVRCQVQGQLACRRIGAARPVHALLVRDDGELVAGGDDGLLFVRGEATRLLGKKQRAPFRAVWALTEDAGTLYVGATNGLFWGAPRAFQPGARLSRASVVQGSLPDDWVTALLSRGEELYVGTYNAGVARFSTRDGKLTRDAVNGSLGHVNPAGLVALPGDELAVASMEGLWRGSLAAPSRSRAGDVTAVARVPGAGGSARYWVGTRRGLQSWDAN
jgi:ligand-binding sensor domain-containing protein